VLSFKGVLDYGFSSDYGLLYLLFNRKGLCNGNWKKKLTDIGFGFLGYRTFYKKLTETVFKDNVLVFSFGIG
jgi:hypothetical protein